MNKPEKQTLEFYDYDYCSQYIAEKLGLKSLRDTLGKFDNSSPIPYEGERKNFEYRDFWHFLCEVPGFSNGSYIEINDDDLERANEWQKVIVQAFIDEFGEDANYFVSG